MFTIIELPHFRLHKQNLNPTSDYIRSRIGVWPGLSRDWEGSHRDAFRAGIGPEVDSDSMPARKAGDLPFRDQFQSELPLSRLRLTFSR